MDYEGGCQCGRVRYHAKGPRDRAAVCHCRMCQRAGASPFMAFVRFPAEAVTWTTPPETFRSSTDIDRGFCGACGTPLTYRNLTGPWLSVTLSSLDDPTQVRPELSFAGAQRAPWLESLGALPEKDMDLTTTAGFVNYQHP